MIENLTEIAFILDRSGSMESMRPEAIGGFNSFLQRQQEDPDPARISLILFDHEYDPLYFSVPAESAKPLTDTTYAPRGTTALLDAMGRTIDDLGRRLAALPETERPGKVLIVTLTDGMENASCDYTIGDIKDRISQQEGTYNWDFIFLASDPRAMNLSDTLGIASNLKASYAPSKGGTTIAFTESANIVQERRARRQNPTRQPAE